MPKKSKTEMTFEAIAFSVIFTIGVLAGREGFWPGLVFGAMVIFVFVTS